MSEIIFNNSSANSLVFEVDKATMIGRFKDNISHFNEGSNLVNELVVRVGSIAGAGTGATGAFKWSKLDNGERLWITLEFGEDGDDTHIVRTQIMAERSASLLTNTRDICSNDLTGGLSARQEPVTHGTEYYFTLPRAVLLNAGTWKFSLARRVIVSSTETDVDIPVYDDEGEITHYITTPVTSYIFGQSKTSTAYSFVINKSVTSIAPWNDFDVVTNATIMAVWQSVIENRGTFKGEWSSSAEYIVGDSVLYNDVLYLCIQETESGADAPTPIDTEYWKAYGIITVATHTANGLMSATDKTRLDSIFDAMPEDYGEDNKLVSNDHFEEVTGDLDNAIGEAKDDIEDLETAVTNLQNDVEDLGDDIAGEITRAGNAESELEGDIEAVEERVATIEGKIPAGASSSNQLADKNFVNSSVQTATANFRGNWENWASVPIDDDDYPADATGSTTPTTNDYMVVQDASAYVSILSQTYEGTWRFKYSGVWATDGRNGWHPEYQVNETPLTSAQLQALNSGATAEKIENIERNTTAIYDVESDVTSLQSRATNVENRATAIESKIPSSASSTNQLADKQFVTDLVGDIDDILTELRGNIEE